MIPSDPVNNPPPQSEINHIKKWSNCSGLSSAGENGGLPRGPHKMSNFFDFYKKIKFPFR